MSESESPFWPAASGEIPPPPAARLLGWKVLEAVPGSGRIRVQFTATHEFTNPLGNIQGGFIAAMLDDTLGPALATTFAPNEFAPTLEIKVSFVRAAKPGTLYGKGELLHRGSSIAFMEGELHDSSDRLIATATATARLIKVESGNFDF
ncbi:MAG: PaaI family thioesterase [Pseudomonadota bacterium]